MLASLRHRLHEAFVRWALRVRPPEPAPIVLTQRRVYVLPTRAGLAYAMALGVILLGAMNYNLSLGHALVFLLAGLGIVTILHTFRNLVLIAIRPGRCEPVFAGSLAQFDLVLENRRPDARTCLRLFIGDETPIEVDVAPHAGTVATLNVAATKRGWLPMPRLTIETTWPLGLVRAWSYAVPDLNCLIYPAPAAKAPPLPWRGESGRGSTKDGRGADDFSGLRDHQVADPPRHVAWKAVARQQDGPLLTKLFEGAAAQQVWLDWEALPDTIDTERRLSILARWILDANAAGLAWGLRLPGVRLAPDNGPAQLAGGLRALALHHHGAQ
ncbi:MAG: DUF58 domain-containing protein [Sulfuritalea sp.]|jgi:uncharacterized protein (DUF58 family)|nr:DUF58 domain-containing protein [Sulfuritalea sp.]